MAALQVTIGIAALIFAIVKVNDWGWTSPGIALSLVVAAVFLGLFVRHCLTSSNPFVDPTLFRIRQFTGATLVMGPYSAAFGAMLLSIALWGQTAWGWSALQAGLVIVPGPLCVPFTSLLFAGPMIKRFGAWPVLMAGICCFTSAFFIWIAFVGLQPDPVPLVVGMIATGIGVGLTFPLRSWASAPPRCPPRRLRLALA